LVNPRASMIGVKSFSSRIELSIPWPFVVMCRLVGRAQ
jgi:hypothetical protein